MKMVVLMYLDDDRDRVARLMEQHGVAVFSQLSMEGRHSRESGGGWYGEVSPYRSAMTLAVLPGSRARELLEAVASMTDVADPDHPVHATVLDVEAAVHSFTPKENGP